MSALKELHEKGQSVWLDSISREMLQTGTLAKYIAELSVTGLTSNPTIFEKAISGTNAYDGSIRGRIDQGLSPERLFFELALEDISAAADLLRPAFDASQGRDGFASLEVSPTLADDSEGTIAEAKTLFARVERPNVFIKVPGTQAGLVAIEELIFAGVPINVTLLFSRGQYKGAAEAFLRGVERRVEAALDPNVASVASLFISRWDAHTASILPKEFANRIGIAIAHRSFRVYRDLLDSERWQRLAAAGAQPQRLLWASTGAKDPTLPSGYYITALAAEGTVNTMPEKTLLDFGQQGEVAELLGTDTTDADRVIEEALKTGVDGDALASRLQIEGRDLFVESWNDLLRCLEAKRGAMQADE